MAFPVSPYPGWAGSFPDRQRYLSFGQAVAEWTRPDPTWALFLVGIGLGGAGLLALNTLTLCSGLACFLAHHLLSVRNRIREASRLHELTAESQLIQAKLHSLQSEVSGQTTRLTGIGRSLPGLMFEAHVSPSGDLTFPFFAGSLLAVLGCTADEARRDPDLIFARVDARDRGRRDRLIRTSIAAKASYADVCRVIAPNGSVLWIRCRWCFDREAAGGAVWTVLWTDITEQYENRELAEAANKGKTDAVARISHDLRTPLNAIIGFTDLLLAEALPAKERKYATAAGQAAQALLWLVNQLLTYQKTESQTSGSGQVTYRLDQLIAQSVSLLEPVADQKGLKLEVSLAPDLPAFLIGDPERLQQILVNLLSNAVKFTSAGSIHLWVTRLDHSAADVALRFAVRDQGIGIPPEKLATLFSPYTQASPATGWLFGGSGLGLAICRQVAQSLGGTVGAASEPGSGSTFWLEVRQGIAENRVTQPDAATIVDTDVARRARILVADDLSANRELVAAILERSGHDVHLARDGVEAVQAAAEGKFDLILMDVQMPEMDGLQAAAAIRTGAGPNRATPIIALTAGANEDDVARSRSAGMDTHVSKPVAPADLLRAVGRWAQGSVEEALPVLDADWISSLAERVGAEKVVQYLGSFIEEATAFGDICVGGDRHELGTMAHRLVGGAGQLGFRALSAASRDLMLACHDPGTAVGPASVATQRNLQLAVDAGRRMIAHIGGATP